MRKDGRLASAKGESDDQECGRQCWASAQNHEAHNIWRGGAQILKKVEDDARLSDRCEAKRKVRAKNWHWYESAQNVEDKQWKMKN